MSSKTTKDQTGRHVEPKKTPLRVPKMAELIAKQLRREIVSGELGIGTHLPTEGELIERFNVSRSTVREAVRVLEMDGLISTNRGRRDGARVLPPNLHVAARHTGMLLRQQETSVGDVYTARMAIEPFAARLLAQNATPEIIDMLRELLEVEKKEVDNSQAWGCAAIAFHKAIVEHCGNKTLAVLGGQLQEIVEGQTAAEMAHVRETPRTDDYKAVDRVHARLINLIEKGDGDGAEKLWRKHLEVAWPRHIITEFISVEDLLD